MASITARRTEGEIEEMLIVGAPSTTPDLRDVIAQWPSLWLFSRMLVALAAGTFLCVLGWTIFKNELALPAIMVFGAFAVPLTMVFFYFEVNVARNVSIYQVAKMILIGGAVSLVYSWIAYTVLPARPGIVEELGKAAALLFIVGNVRYRWTLNGLLFGGAVGAGFAGIETAGYAFEALLHQQNVIGSLITRALLAPGGHVVWAALLGAALWKVRGAEPFAWGMLADWRFVRVLLFTITLHTIWDMDVPIIDELPIPFVKLFALAAIALVAVFGFVQDGLRQIRTAQGAAGRAEAAAA